jgi:hypothetical protein
MFKQGQWLFNSKSMSYSDQLKHEEALWRIDQKFFSVFIVHYASPCLYFTWGMKSIPIGGCNSNT